MLTSLKEENKGKGKRCLKLEAKLNGLKSQVAVLTTEKNSLSHEKDVIEKEITQKDNEIGELKDKIDAHQCDMNVVTDENEQLKCCQNEKDQENESLRSQLSQAQLANESLQANSDSVQSNLEHQIQEKGALLSELRQKIENLVTEIEEEKTKNAELETSMSGVTEKYNQHEDMIDRLKEELQNVVSIKQTNNELQKQCDDLKGKIEESRSLEESVKSQLEDLKFVQSEAEIANEELKTQKDELQRCLDEAATERSSLQTELQNLQEQISTLEQQNNQLSKSDSELKKLQEQISTLQQQNEQLIKSNVSTVETETQNQMPSTETKIEKQPSHVNIPKVQVERVQQSASPAPVQLVSQSPELEAKLQKAQTENEKLRELIGVLRSKMDAILSERQVTVAELSEVKGLLASYEKRHPEVSVYRQKLDDLHATMRVTWIENEELKNQVMGYRQQLGLDDPVGVELPSSASAEHDPYAGARALQQEMNALKVQHGEATAQLKRDLEDSKAKVKELRIEYDSLKTHYEQQARMKDKQHIDSLNEMSRQVEKVKGQFAAIQRECRAAQTHGLALEQEKEAVQKAFAEAVDKLKEDHRRTVAGLNHQLEQASRASQQHVGGGDGQIEQWMENNRRQTEQIQVCDI